MSGTTELGACLNKKRRRTGLSLRALEEKSGVTNSYISQIETGARHPSRETVEALCSAMGVDSSDMLAYLDPLGPEAVTTEHPDPTGFDAAWEFTGENQAYYQVERVRATLQAFESGGAEVSKLFWNARPIKGRPIDELRLEDSASALGANYSSSGIRVKHKPEGLKIEESAEEVSGRLVHIIGFPNGYSYEDGPIVFDTWAIVEQALTSDETDGGYFQCAVGWIETLELIASIPESVPATGWRSLAWTGLGPSGKDILPTSCRSSSLTRQPCKAQLIVKRPAVGVSFAVGWTGSAPNSVAE